jgi:EAL domain-containing protein (putative c-di-GMP-specific phosphodiesterase class I)
VPGIDLKKMSSPSATASSTFWFLVGPQDEAGSIRSLPIFAFPFVIGRRQDLPLALSCNKVSSLHAEITEVNHSLVLRDLGSTNGTYVNGCRATGPVRLAEGDLVQFACMPFRVRKQSGEDSPHTVLASTCDQALALVQFDKLMSQRTVTPYLQPIVHMQSHDTVAYEVLARSRLFGLQTPGEMFGVAAQLDLDVELSAMMRWEGVRASLALAEPPHLYVNTHPRELASPTLARSLESLRQRWPDQPLTLEIHESAINDGARLVELRGVLKELDIGLAYDDFGVGQSRLKELVETAPDCVKFDMSLIHNIDRATAQRQQIVATLVRMVGDLGIATLAEGVETIAEDATCRQMGFVLGQGYLYGRPAVPEHFV